MKALLKTRQFGRRLGLTDRTVREWIATRKIEVIKVGAGVRIPSSEVDRLIREGRRPAARPAPTLDHPGRQDESSR